MLSKIVLSWISAFVGSNFQKRLMLYFQYHLKLSTLVRERSDVIDMTTHSLLFYEEFFYKT